MSLLRWIALTLLPLPLLIACASSTVRPSSLPNSLDLEEVPLAVTEARNELARGEGEDLRYALGRLDIASDTEGLTSDQQREILQLRTIAVQARLQEISGGEPSRVKARTLEAIAQLELPGELAVRLTVEAASQWLAVGERRKSYKVLKKLDEQYPLHAERIAAGSILAEAGLSLAYDTGSYGLFFEYAALAPDVLVYFTTNYPDHPRGPEAYLALSHRHEQNRRWDAAILNHQDLILFYPNSPEAVESRAQVPHLRLAMLASPEYDRSVLVLARAELDSWLADNQHIGHAMEASVTLDRLACIQRMADNDLVVARFYERVDNATGAQFHARRAVEFSRDGGDVEQIREAERLLAAVSTELVEGRTP
jgi:tetratricopeptide (TPR) repeat protein